MLITILIPGDIMLKYFLISSGSLDTPFNNFFNATTLYTSKYLKKTADVSIFLKTSLFIGHFSHASISKIVNCPLVEIGEKFHAFTKKRTISLKLWS